jgi:Bacteriophage minor capsid protein
MSTLSLEIAQYFHSISLGVYGVNLFHTQLTDSPADQLSVMLPVGGNPSIFSPTTTQIIVVRVRNTSIVAGDVKTQQVFSALHDKLNILAPIPGALHIVGYSQCTRLPIYLGPDPRGLHLFTVEAEMNVNTI